MGLAVPRPAMRGREERIIRAKLEWGTKRMDELVGQGWTKEDASKQAFGEVRSMHKWFISQDRKALEAKRND